MNSLMNRLEAMGLTRVIVCTVAWIVCGIAATGAAAVAVSELPAGSSLIWVYGVSLILLSVVVSFGGLIAYWTIASLVEFRHRGYRVRVVAPNHATYEERVADGAVRTMPFGYKTVRDGYPRPCEVHIPSEACWDRRVPAWAQGRRAEIVQHIAHCWRDLVTFVDAEPGNGSPATSEPSGS